MEKCVKVIVEVQAWLASRHVGVGDWFNFLNLLHSNITIILKIKLGDNGFYCYPNVKVSHAKSYSQR
jgi:hypothetical protein